jgi:branched-chain amino acid transport system ATP-binding protein
MGLMLQAEGLTKWFGGVSAVNNVALDVKEGEILGLIGPNGAGKSTLLNLISGLYAPSSGTIRFQGKDITHLPAHKKTALGIGRIFQSSNLFMSLSVLENVFVGCHLHYRTAKWKRFLRLPSARSEEAELRAGASSILDMMGLGAAKAELARNLPHGHQRILSICIALATRPKLLLLDEPVTGMNPTETQTTMNLIRKVRDNGTTIILVEHDMKTVMQLCERIVVLNYGEVIARGVPEEIRQNKEVIEAYLGKEEEEGGKEDEEVDATRCTSA